MKWSTDNDMKSLSEAQAALFSVLANVKRQLLTFQALVLSTAAALARSTRAKHT